MRKISGLSSAAYRAFHPTESTARRAFLWIAFFALLPLSSAFSQNIPLPEHPRPDFHRTAWRNLNGTWGFAFDSLDVGMRNAWFEGKTTFAQTIQVPFPWGSKLSGVADEADIAWYQRSVAIPSDWSGQRIFLVVGASDWETSAWVDGHKVGTHQGGYTPFSFELTPYVKAGQNSLVSIRVDDKRRDFTLYGKQGYGNARGIWQTVYLEARAATFLEYVHCTPDIERQEVGIELSLDKVPQQDLLVQAEIKTPAGPLKTSFTYPKGARTASARIRLPEQRLWTLEDPYLYEMSVQVGEDRVDTYFGMRKISTAKLPGTDYTYVALNNKPLYLQLTLDQSYHPDGFYTFPSDEFMRNEIQLCKDIGLNGIRTHIKVDIPRKLYWADKLGLLVMSDLPNSWGQPDEAMQAESERTLREMIRRDYNHPSIFSWIVFNETWGLSSKVQNPDNGKEESRYLPRTQQWVASMYYLAKSLDPTRLVEDNSICCGAGHTETDINSWHEYLPGWAWEERLKTIDEKTFVGSTYHFQPGFQQGDQPNINSECGNVWGYDGSTGDVDWSWDYHRMMNTFRKYPKVAGWLYTEHHDVINEWNGYWRFDRSPKFTGLEELAEGMSARDFHSPFYISTGNDICVTVKGGEKVSIPLYLSVMSDMPVPDNRLSLEITGTFMDKTGMEKTIHRSSRTLDYAPWIQASLPAETFLAPAWSGLGRVQLLLKDPSNGKVLHHNVFHFVVDADAQPDKVRVFEQRPAAFSAANWSLKQWQVLDGHKVNGAGKGFFEYRIPLAGLNLAQVAEAHFLIEVSSKPLLDKDRDKSFSKDQDYMLGARVSPHQNPNAYPMTDAYQNPSELRVSIPGAASQVYRLADDPADHRGVLSWHSQPKDRKLYEAGTFGYLVRIPLSRAVLKAAQQQGYLEVRLEADNGLAVYGDRFGRYPINPSVVVRMR